MTNIIFETNTWHVPVQVQVHSRLELLMVKSFRLVHLNYANRIKTIICFSIKQPLVKFNLQFRHMN